MQYNAHTFHVINPGYVSFLFKKMFHSIITTIMFVWKSNGICEFFLKFCTSTEKHQTHNKIALFSTILKYPIVLLLK